MIPGAERQLYEIYLQERAAEEDSCEEGAGAARSAAMACLVQRRLAR
jgi:hypothetical protein